MTPDNEWVRSLRREIWSRLRMKTMRWPVAGDSHCAEDEQSATALDDRARVIVRDVEEIGPSIMLGG